MLSSLLAWPALLALAFGYLLGSIPFGLVLTRVAGLGDVRAIGSGNIGATNVLRTGRRGLAAATLLLDALKATAAVLFTHEIGKRYMPFEVTQLEYMAGLGAFLGHLFPAWLGFKGGKGVATFIGALVGVHWPAAVLFCLVWLIVAGLSRYSSLAALAATLLVVVYYATIGPAGLAFILLMTVLIFVKHHANIRRLLRGEESKIGAKSAATDAAA